MDLTSATTKELVEELSKRDGVQSKSANEYETAYCSIYSKQFGSLLKHIDVPTGPARILVVID